MKMRLITLALVCLFITPSFAGSISYYVYAYDGAKTTAVSVEMNADYVAIPLSIGSNQRDSEDRFAEIRNAQNLILAKAKKQDGILAHKGPISLSPQPRSKLESISSHSYSRSSIAQFHIMAKLEENGDVYTCATRIRQFLDSIKMPPKTEIYLDPIQLVIANPEQYRKEILTKISQDVAFVKQSIQSSGKVSITGLEQPVLVRQVDDQKVELFINYSMTMELSKKGIITDKE